MAAVLSRVSPTRAKTPGTPGGLGGVAAGEAILQAVGNLARSLFGDRARNPALLSGWLQQPLPSGKTEVSAKPVSWKEAEARRQAARTANVAGRVSPMSDALAKPAATALLGKRAVRPPSTVLQAAVKEEESVRGAGPVRWLSEVLHAILLCPVSLTVACEGIGDQARLTLYPFGRGRFAQFRISEDQLNAVELGSLQYLGMSADAWIHEPLSATASAGSSTPPEVLVANIDANAAFEISLDRMSLVGAVCEHIVRHAGPRRIRYCHVLEAALMMTSGRADVVQAGYLDGLVQLTRAVRENLPRECALTLEEARNVLAERASFAAANGVIWVEPEAHAEKRNREARLHPGGQPARKVIREIMSKIPIPE